MHDQAPYRELHNSLLSYKGDALERDLLTPWLTENTGEQRWLQVFASRPGNPIPEATWEELWRLYGLSRVIELLLLRFQEGDADGTPWWPGPPITLNEFVAFVERLGLSVAEVDAFAPFDHEMVRVDSENSQRSVCVVHHY